jgi:hypothetical protein
MGSKIFPNANYPTFSSMIFNVSRGVAALSPKTCPLNITKCMGGKRLHTLHSAMDKIVDGIYRCTQISSPILENQSQYNPLSNNVKEITLRLMSRGDTDVVVVVVVVTIQLHWWFSPPPGVRPCC